MKFSNTFFTVALLVLLSVVGFSQDEPQKQTYVEAGFVLNNSTSDFGGYIPGFTFGGQKDFGNVRVKGNFTFNTHPLIATLFQEGAVDTKLPGYEIRLNPEVEYTPFKRNTRLLVPLGKPFIGVGVDYFHQSFPQEPFGKEAHFHNGLNPTVSVGTTFDIGENRHYVSVTRTFQEPKFRKYSFQSLYYHEDGDFFHVHNERHKGLLNPSYLEGWGLKYEYSRPLTKRVRFALEFTAKRVKYRECIIRASNTGAGAPNCDSYYETDNIFGLTPKFQF